MTPALLIAESLEFDETLPDKLRNDIGMIKRNISLEVQLIDDLLDLTKISKGKLVLRTEPVSVHDLLQHTVQLLNQSIEETGLQVQWRLEASDYYVEGDPPRLQQILWNILKNAIKFTPSDGMITVSTFNRNGQICIDIIDTGVGMEEELIPKIFSSFEQGKQWKQFGGLGLGLAISKALATMHHGSLTAASEGPGKGSY